MWVAVFNQLEPSTQNSSTFSINYVSLEIPRFVYMYFLVHKILDPAFWCCHFGFTILEYYFYRAWLNNKPIGLRLWDPWFTEPQIRGYLDDFCTLKILCKFYRYYFNIMFNGLVPRNIHVKIHFLIFWYGTDENIAVFNKRAFHYYRFSLRRLRNSLLS